MITSDGDTTSTSSAPATSTTTSPAIDDQLKLLTTEEVAALLQVHALTVRRAVKAKLLRCVRIGRSTRFSRDDVERYIKSMSTTGARKIHAPKRVERSTPAKKAKR